MVTANQKLASLQAKVEKLKDARKVLFQDLASRWLEVVKADQKGGSWARRNSAVNSLNRFFKGQWLRAISLEMVENWKIKRSGETTGRGKKVSSRTLNIELETLNLILGYAAKHGYLLENPAVGIQKNKVLKRQVTPPTKKQFAQLVTELRRLTATAKAADFVEFLGYSGLRLDEANEVVWADVEWTRERMYVTGGSEGPKNMEEKRIPLFRPLRELLERMKAKIPDAIASDLLFPRRSGSSAAPDPNKRASPFRPIRSLWKRPATWRASTPARRKAPWSFASMRRAKSKPWNVRATPAPVGAGTPRSGAATITFAMAPFRSLPPSTSRPAGS